MNFKNQYGEGGREPVFNIPTIVLVTTAVISAPFLLSVVLPAETGQRLFLEFAFIPARFEGLPPEYRGLTHDGPLWSLLTMVTYAGLHGGPSHLALNAVWLMTFGSPVARGLTPLRFVILFILCAIAGAGAFWLTHPGEMVPVVGASGAISGLMGAGVRYLFAAGPLNRRVFVAPVGALAPLNSPQFLGFSAVWLGLNLVFGLIGMTFGEGAGIAWEAHMGGYFAGALLVSVLSPSYR